MNTKQLAIITKEKVDTTFENEPAYLHAEILPVFDDPINEKRRYKVRTDMVGYKDVVVGQDENDDDIIEQHLTWLETKQDWSAQELTYAEINVFATQLEPMIPEGLSKIERDILELKTMFLLKRQEDAPWGVAPDKWRIRTEEDLKQ